MGGVIRWRFGWQFMPQFDGFVHYYVFPDVSADGKQAVYGFAASGVMASTSPFTAATLLANSASSDAVRWTSIIRSTPPPPSTTGTPT